jgi:hypothetical protein
MLHEAGEEVAVEAAPDTVVAVAPVAVVAELTGTKTPESEPPPFGVSLVTSVKRLQTFPAGTKVKATHVFGPW